MEEKTTSVQASGSGCETAALSVAFETRELHFHAACGLADLLPARFN